MKKIIIVYSLLICSCTAKVQYPKYVHNKCLNKWAVLTGIGKADHDWYEFTSPSPDKEKLYYGKAISINLSHPSDDEYSINNACVAAAHKFDDSMSAVKSYAEFINYKKHYNDSVVLFKKITDSINKCKETYE